jgi:hypothetical protein
MSRPWHKKDSRLLEQIKKEVQGRYPNLHFYPHNDRVIVRGTFPILEEGKELDRYAVEIALLADFPESVPLVWEVGGRIPRNADYHINAGGEACLFVPDERWRAYPPGATFLQFLDGPVRNFFLGQSIFRETCQWPFGQRPHGAPGIYQYYEELLGCADKEIVREYIDFLRKPQVKGHFSCPCKSGKIVRQCHRQQLADLRAKIPYDVAERSWGFVSKHT